MLFIFFIIFVLALKTTQQTYSKRIPEIYQTGASFLWLNYIVNSEICSNSTKQRWINVTDQGNTTLKFQFQAWQACNQKEEQKKARLIINQKSSEQDFINSSFKCYWRDFEFFYEDNRTYGDNLISYIYSYALINLKYDLRRFKIFFYIFSMNSSFILAQDLTVNNEVHKYMCNKSDITVVLNQSFAGSSGGKRINFQIKQIIQKLVQKECIQPNDIITSIDYRIVDWDGSGTLNITFNNSESSKRQEWKFKEQPYHFVNQLFRCQDESHISSLQNRTRDAQIIFRSQQNQSKENQSIKAYQRFILPINRSQVKEDFIHLKSLSVNFTYENNISSNNLGVQICLSIILNRFIEQIRKKNQTIQIHVCNNQIMSPKSKNIKEQNISNKKYRKIEFNFSEYEKGNLFSSTFKFYSVQSLDNLENFNLIPFMKNVNDENPLDGFQIIELRAGFALYFGQGNLTLKKLNFITEFGQTFEEHQNQIYKKMVSIIGSNSIAAVKACIQIPNIGLLIKITPLIALIDDLSYFVYYNLTRFNTGFRFFSELSWNWTHSKWDLPQPIGDALGVNLSSTQNQPQRSLKDYKKITPIRLTYRTEDLFFLNNCKGYLLCTVPFSVILFIILWKLYWKFHEKKIASLITSFSSFTYLFSSLVGQNAQFLAFNCFKQLRYVIPTQGSISWINLILNFFLLVSLLICVVSIHLLAWRMARSTFKHGIIKRQFGAFAILNLFFVIKFLCGMIHAYLQGEFTRCCCILLTQVLFNTLLLYGGYKKIAKNQIAYAFLVYGQIFRMVLFFNLLIETTFTSSITLAEDNELRNMTYIIVCTIIFCNILQILFTILGKLWVKEQPHRANLQRKLQPSSTNQQLSKTFETVKSRMDGGLSQQKKPLNDTKKANKDIIIQKKKVYNRFKVCRKREIPIKKIVKS